MKAVTICVSLMLSIATIAHAQEPLNTQRIASVDANATELLIGFGLQDHLVAVDVTSQKLVAHMKLPNLGYHRALSAEGLLSTDPSLIIGSSHMGPKAVIEVLNSAAVPLIQLPAASTIEALTQNIQLLGDALGLETEAANLLATVRGAQQRIAEAKAGHEPSIIFVMDMSNRGLSKAGNGTTGDALIRILGGINPSLYSGYQSIAIEALLELDPDVILVGSESLDVDGAAVLLKANPQLAHSRAAQTQQVITVDASKMVAGVSMGVLSEAERISQLIY